MIKTDIHSFRNASLVLIGHGSTKNAASTITTYQHGEELRRRNVFREVLHCFWKVEPTLHGVLSRVQSARVFIMPLFLSDGYFTQEIIPLTLGLKGTADAEFVRIQEKDGRMLHYCRPIGTHPKITGVILARAREVTARRPFPRPPRPEETALFLAAHGTTENPESRLTVDRQVEAIRAMKLFAEVHAVFLEEPPQIGDCYKLGQAPNFVVIPFFMAEGLHTVEDIPVFLGESAANVQSRLASGMPTWRNPTEKHGKRVWVAQCIGTEPAIADLILERVREMASLAKDSAPCLTART